MGPSTFGLEKWPTTSWTKEHSSACLKTSLHKQAVLELDGEDGLNKLVVE